MLKFLNIVKTGTERNCNAFEPVYNMSAINPATGNPKIVINQEDKIAAYMLLHLANSVFCALSIPQ